DGDSPFETGEIITICEDITLLNCFENLSEYLATWGCGGNTCQSSFETANAFFPGIVPAIVTSSTFTNDICFDNINKQTITITNNGPGNATNVKIDMFQVNNTVFSDVDISSLFYIDGSGDTI